MSLYSKTEESFLLHVVLTVFIFFILFSSQGILHRIYIRHILQLKMKNKPNTKLFREATDIFLVIYFKIYRGCSKTIILSLQSFYFKVNVQSKLCKCSNRSKLCSMWIWLLALNCVVLNWVFKFIKTFPHGFQLHFYSDFLKGFFFV